MKILEGRELAAEILALFDQPGKLRCAVAFWGPDLAKLARGREAEVVLDISMGGTSRNALKAFGLRRKKLPDPSSKVTVLDGMHAKIFLGEKLAIIGSANASRNALGNKENPPALSEAGVVVDRELDPVAYGRVEEIYKGYLERSLPVTTRDWERAVRASGNPAARDYAVPSGPAPASILRALLDRPEDFGRVSFIFADDEVDAEERAEANAAYVKEVGQEPKNARRSLVCMLDDDPDTDAKLRGAFHVINYWFTRPVGIYAYHDIVRIEHADATVSYFGRRGWPKIREELGMPRVTKDEAWRQDLAVAEDIAASEGQEPTDRFVVLTSDELFEHMERSHEGD
ncbi:phospholipase D family protein [Sphingomonas sp. AOB5]|uniref:phospholipase D family protein n=1 Tax=Sphingomonas sp. AOB5 TaxID=3034017 RepID=UPI0023F6BDB5|nr:phospholipase D family protein [Sphingomonas sp. AOB5]MDF7773767.1 phospholipase D family protein [Sphingomonas sp. AOB5]